MSLERRNHGRGHSYWIDGTKVPGITTILGDGVPKPALVRWAAGVAADYAVDHWDELGPLKPSERGQLIRKAPDSERSSAGLRGTHVHALAERLAAGEEVEVDDAHVGLVDAYLRFTEDWAPVEIFVERPVFHRALMYAGTPDLLATLRDGKRWLLDWKTGASGIWPEHALQLAAARYAEVVLLEDGTERAVLDLDIERTGCVHLMADGTYELRPVEAGPDAFRAFFHAKEVAAFAKSPRDDWVGDAATPMTVRG